MSLIDLTPNVPQVSKEELLKKAVANIKERISTQFRSNVATHKSLWNMVWNNPSLSPQEIFDAVYADDPTQVVELLTVSKAFGMAINTVIPNAVEIVPPKNLDVTEDGRAVVTE